MHKRSYKFVIQSLLVLCALAFVPFLYFYSQLAQIEVQTEKHVEQLSRNKLEYAKVELQMSLSKVSTSLRYLSHNNILIKAVKEPSVENLDALEDFWLLIARTQGYFSQLRFLDAEGMEIVRVNSGQAFVEIVDRNRLQDKGDRDYFAYAKDLKDAQMGTFGIDLELENGEIVHPLVPAYRIIYPIVLDGKRHGYFIANLDLPRIYKGLAYKRNLTNLPNVITQDGYYLMSNDGDNIMGHLVDKHKEDNVANQYPALWRSIQLNESGTVKEDNYWISYTQANLYNRANLSVVTLLMKTSLNDAQAFIKEEKLALYQQAFFVSIILILLTFTFVTWNYTHEKNSLDSKIARAAMNGMSAMVITDRNNRIVQVNEEFTRVSGFELEDVIGKQPSLFSSGKHDQSFYLDMWRKLESEGLWEGEVVNKRRDGSLITEILRIQTIKDKRNTIQFYVASFVDISHRKQLEDRLRELSERDPMTSLWNRRKFDKEMQSQAARALRYKNNEQTTLALIDIDHFKRINDKYGHDQGDAVIKSVSDSLTKHLRETDLVARIGGEEFAVIMSHTDLVTAETVLNRVRISIHLESELNITVSVGITEISEQPEMTYKRADIALYESKSMGRNQVSVMSASESHSIA
ncbi:sensor domain-containing diguanylate cyclase [Vibrio sp. RE86]|uniref:sensor domain-containing diguanylate cyclase n=1 Tax=Vibrio sp. RE86 TaxID=2607605 RepID=UPI001493CD2F|nr:diguanylate cyclase [Vibrio sp. RE86]NOH81096.1 sensor domain-containing diguanylate cyclase [Vibrio sp. RE86]